MYVESMYRRASSMVTGKPTWIAQRRHEGQVEYFSIVDPIETQQLLHDVIKVFIYGYVTEVGHGLNAEAKPWFPHHFPQSKTSTIIQDNITNSKKNKHSRNSNSDFHWNNRTFGRGVNSSRT